MRSLRSAFRVVSIHGVPRSGTSWLGQIFSSHPDVAYRHQPLFAYRFKDRINLNSTKAEILGFLQELYDVTDDDFVLDRRDAYKALHLSFQKACHPRFLVIKMVRYHHLIEKLMRDVENIKIIGIVRHPCAVINSWLQAPKEFRTGWDPMKEWRYAPKKNQGRIEEYNGFEKWKEVAQMLLRFEGEYSDRFQLVRYEDLVVNPVSQTARLFDFAGLEMHEQTLRFIRMSQAEHDKDPYSVYKRPGVRDRWTLELNERIVDEILGELDGTRLGRFLA